MRRRFELVRALNFLTNSVHSMRTTSWVRMRFEIPARTDLPQEHFTFHGKTQKSFPITPLPILTYGLASSLILILAGSGWKSRKKMKARFLYSSALSDKIVWPSVFAGSSASFRPFE